MEKSGGWTVSSLHRLNLVLEFLSDTLHRVRELQDGVTPASARHVFSGDSHAEVIKHYNQLDKKMVAGPG